MATDQARKSTDQARESPESRLDPEQRSRTIWNQRVLTVCLPKSMRSTRLDWHGRFEPFTLSFNRSFWIGSHFDYDKMHAADSGAVARRDHGTDRDRSNAQFTLAGKPASRCFLLK